MDVRSAPDAQNEHPCHTHQHGAPRGQDHPEALQWLISSGRNALARGSTLSLLEAAHGRPVSPPEPLITAGQWLPGYKAAFEDARSSSRCW